jgi:DNA-binding NtrC family response regulator
MTDRILIVDDEKDTREFMARALSGKYEVLTAADAEFAMKQLDADRSIRLLLSDVRMPGEDGITLMKAAKAMNPGLAVILLTAFGSIDQAVAAM